MKLIAFHFHFKLQNQAGSSRMRNLAIKLSERGHNLTIFTGSSCRDGMKDNNDIKILKRNLLFYEAIYSEKIRIISLPCFYKQKFSFLRRVLTFLNFNFLACIMPFFLEKKADIYFASSTPLTISLPAILMSKIFSKPFVFEVRDLWPDAPIQMGIIKNKIFIFFAKFLENFSYKNASLIITLTRGVKRIIEERCNKPTKFLPIGVDDIFFIETFSSKLDSHNSKKFEVIYSGACGYNNAIEVLFNVAELAHLQNLTDKIRFTIIGDGPGLETIKEKATPNLNLLGKLPKPKVAEVLKKSDLALFSQRRVYGGNFKKDVIGNKYFDFIGAGLPIVIGSVPNGEMAKEIKNKNIGLVCEPEDASSLFEAVLKIYSNKKILQSMSQASKDLAQKYKQEKIYEQFCFELEDLVS
jgi:glycosyltransferase involved in cell wall biosynthesis